MLEVEKAKTVFLRSASHELKTPLAGLRILLENMQYGVGKYKDRDTYLPQAVEKVDELTEMVKNILDTSRQQETLPANVVAVKKEVDTVLSNYAMQIAEKALEVRAEFPPEVHFYEIAGNDERQGNPHSAGGTGGGGRPDAGAVQYRSSAGVRL